MSRKLLEKNFCAIPWTGFELDPDGRVKNCIISKDAIGNLNKKPIKDAIAIIIGKEIKLIRFSLINFVFALLKKNGHVAPK